MMKVPEYISSISPYVPGKPVEELERELGISNSIKLASNENPIGPSPRAVEALGKNLMNSLNRYPDGGAYYLKEALSEKLGVKNEELIIGNGSNELLDIAVKTFMQPGDEAVMAWPSFVVYPLATQAQGAISIKVPLIDMRHNLNAMADAVTEKTRMIFIANPNNPTGTMNTMAEIDEFMARIPDDILVVMDEAYYEYVTDSSYADSIKHFRAGRNVLLLRTFSKIYGLAGLRIGYGIAKPEILTQMNKIREPFNTSTPAQAAALAALGDAEHVERSVRVNDEGKRYLYGEFKRLKVKYVPTHANFVYITPAGRDSGEIYDYLLRQGVIVRPAGPGALRITIGLEDENKRFIAALENILQGE